MPDAYKNTQSEAEEKKTWRLVPFGRPLGKAKFGGGVPPVRRGLKNPLLLLEKQAAGEKEKERKRNLKYLKKAKIQDRMS
jgi:hypothetical protein